MLSVWVYTLVSVLIVSVMSLVGVITLSLKADRLSKILLYLVSFSAGALFGDAFIHLLPEAVENAGGMTVHVSLYVLSGILSFFVLEKIVHWRHCHIQTSSSHPHPVGIMNLVGDGVHNLIDGLVIGASYMVSIPVGVATTLAVVMHEIPQEIGDFGVLLHAGFKRKRAVFMNFLTALTAVAGALLSLTIGSSFPGLVNFLVPFAAGSFIYIASADLIPELKKETALSKSMVQFIFILLGVGIMFSLLAVG